VKLVTENQSVYIPLGAVHRMENPGKVPMVLIEVQTGSYLGEDDIIRYEDIYARGHSRVPMAKTGSECRPSMVSVSVRGCAASRCSAGQALRA
jgi:hypothetical protein